MLNLWTQASSKTDYQLFLFLPMLSFCIDVHTSECKVSPKKIDFIFPFLNFSDDDYGNNHIEKGKENRQVQK